MQKDLTLAIVSGLMLGLLVAFGIWNSQKVIVPNNTLNNNQAVLSTEEETFQSNTTSGELSIETPNSHAVLTSSNLSIQGKTPDSSYIVITNNDDLYVTESSSSQFTESIALSPGVNTIFVSSVKEDGSTNNVMFPVFYSGDYAKQVVPGVESLGNFGAVTDKLESSFQIKDSTGQLLIVGVSDKTTYARTTGTNRGATYDDIGIGDTIVVIYQKTETKQDEIKAERILLIPSPDETIRATQFGTLQNIGIRNGVLKVGDTEYPLVSGPDLTIYNYANNRLTNSRFTNLDNDLSVLAIGNKTEDSFTPDTIVVLP